MEIPKKLGRPTKFDTKLAKKICKRIAAGESLRAICRDAEMPNRATVHDWLLDETKKAFYDQYEQACNVRAENMFDELTEIADDGSNDWMEKENKDGSSFTVLDHEHVQRSRLRIDVRKWYLSKVMPKKFGDKLDLTSGGDKLPTPIYGGNSSKNIQGHDGDEEDI